MQSSSDRLGRRAFAALVVLAYALPLLLSLYWRADFTAMANESVAYRYYAVERIREGEGGNIWLPQGQLTTALHRIAMSALDKFSGSTLRQKLNGFSYLALAIHVVLVLVLLFLAARNRFLDFADQALLAVLILAPTYATRGTGFHFHLFPDYLAVSVILLGFAFLAILSTDRQRPSGDHSARTELSVGSLVGCMVANKVTLAVPAFLVIVSRLATRSGWRGVFVSGAALMVGLTVTFLAILLFIYEFNLRAIKQMVPRWYSFVRNPGAEPDFWSRIFEYIEAYFGYGVGYAIVAVVGFVGLTSLRRAWSPYRAVVLLASVAICVATVVFVAKRPAQTSFFEAFCLLLFVSSALIGTLPDEKYRRRLAVTSACSWLIVVCATFPLRPAISVLNSSHVLADERWRMFEQTIEAAMGRRILVVFPSNEYHHHGVHELILKASAVFPTWVIDDAGQKLVDKLSPGTRYYHEYNPTPSIALAVKDAAVVVWFDRINLPALEDQYVPLRELKQSPAAACERGEYHDAAGQVSHVWWRCIKP